MLRLNSIEVKCLCCNENFTLYIDHFELTTESSEREMGCQVEYFWDYQYGCPCCGADGYVKISAWEYPEGDLEYIEPKSSYNFVIQTPEDDIVEVEEEPDDYCDDEDPNLYLGTPYNSNGTESSSPQIAYCLQNFQIEAAAIPQPQSDVNPPSKQDFINQSLIRVCNDFLNNTLPNYQGDCEINFTFEQGVNSEIDYSEPIVQQFYVLKYFYAYFIEYLHIYSKIELDSLKIFSIGCGCGLDFYAAHFAKGANAIHSYYGIDSCVWLYKDLLSSQRIDIDPYNLESTLDSFTQNKNRYKISDFNVYIFPKSIEYLSENEIQKLEKCIEETTLQESEIYLIVNGMNKNFQDDIKTLNHLVNAFVSSGYKESERDNSVPKKSFYHLSGEGLTYPNDVKKPCSICPKKNNNACTNNKPNWFPMLRTDYFKYQIVKLTKGL